MAVLGSCVLVGLMQLGAPVPAWGDVPGGEAQKPTFVLKAAKGFIDDPIAVDSDGGTLAALRTDSASFARLELIDLATGKPKQIVTLGDPHPIFDRVILAGGDKGVLVITRDPNNGRRRAQFYAMNGKPAGLVGPVADFGITVRSGRKVLIAWDKSVATSGEVTYTIAQYELAGLNQMGKPHGFTVSKAGDLNKPPFKIVGFQDGFGQLIGTRPGAYDKKKDFRQPERLAVFDVLAGAFVKDWEIGDMMSWAFAAGLRAKHPNRTAFALLAADAGAFDLVDPAGRRAPVTMPIPISMYDAKSLAEQEDAAAGVLTFGLAIDSLNPEALARKQQDKTYLDLYTIPVGPADAKGDAKAAAPAATRILRAPHDERPFAWVAGAHHVAVLRKFKAFSRGGNELEVYAVK